MSSLAWNKAHPEKIREAQVRYREHHRNEIRERMRQWRTEHRDYLRQKSKIFRNLHTLKKREYDILKQRAWHFIEDNHHLIGQNCDFCGETQNLKAHHPDYDLPEVIVTCCDSCHAYIHFGVC